MPLIYWYRVEQTINSIKRFIYKDNALSIHIITKLSQFSFLSDPLHALDLFQVGSSVQVVLAEREDFAESNAHADVDERISDQETNTQSQSTSQDQTMK